MKAKDNKGISLVTLIITIIVIIILASITISSGQKQIDTTKEQKLLSELEMVNHAIYERYASYSKTKNVELLIGAKLSSTEVQTLATSIGVNLITIPAEYSENEKSYYRLTPNNLENIGIYNSEDTYVVNYITGEVINETKKNTSSGKVLYIYSRANFNNNDVTAF